MIVLHQSSKTERLSSYDIHLTAETSLLFAPPLTRRMSTVTVVLGVSHGNRRPNLAPILPNKMARAEDYQIETPFMPRHCHVTLKQPMGR